MDNLQKILIGIVILAIVVIVVIYEFSIHIDATTQVFLGYITAVMLIFVIIFILYRQYSKQQKHVGSKTFEVYDRLKEIWQRRTNEVLNWEGGKIIPKELKGKERWGIVVQRTNPNKVGQYIMFIVDEKCDKILVNDNPDNAELKNPFIYHTTFAEEDIAEISGKTTKKEKPKKEEKSKEEKEVDTIISGEEEKVVENANY